MTNTSKSLTLTVPEVAAELRVGERKVWYLIKTGELASIKVKGSRRVVRDALEAYIAGLAK